MRTFAKNDQSVYIPNGHKKQDVEARTVVEIWMPANGLFLHRLKRIKISWGGLAFKYKLQLFLEMFGGCQFFLGFVNIVFKVVLLMGDPVAKVGVGEGLSKFEIQFLIPGVADAPPPIPRDQTEMPWSKGTKLGLSWHQVGTKLAPSRH